ncbi:hypothetical protein E4T81_07230 [Barnesiella sp. WM24]|uniref:hypothetical protein n=1 Tax=Barnesiella sp. WM24 TaxID=2558278 RepID=UPI001071A601|nr:hypothetical protein [Barnesiella sp. WM24]TFU93745.1 hypothetical protein E4T81_07230 [Barnesiella sp. WM24]
MSYSKVLRCNPDGKVSSIDAVTVDYLVNEVLEDVKGVKNVADKAKRLLNVARICHSAGHKAKALKLYNEVIAWLVRDAVATYSQANRALMLEAARGIDAIWREIAPREKRVRETDKVAMFYLEVLDSYLYDVRNIDNDELFNRIDFDLISDYFGMCHDL